MATRSAPAKSGDQESTPEVIEPDTAVRPAQYDDINYGTGVPEGADPAGGVALQHNLANATVNTSSTRMPTFE